MRKEKSKSISKIPDVSVEQHSVQQNEEIEK